jgi:hypothetical protein
MQKAERPQPLRGPAGEAPSAAEALRALSANYAAAHRSADRLDALQDWVRRQLGVR